MASGTADIRLSLSLDEIIEQERIKNELARRQSIIKTEINDDDKDMFIDTDYDDVNFKMEEEVETKDKKSMKLNLSHNSKQMGNSNSRNTYIRPSLKTCNRFVGNKRKQFGCRKNNNRRKRENEKTPKQLSYLRQLRYLRNTPQGIDMKRRKRHFNSTPTGSFIFPLTTRALNEFNYHRNSPKFPSFESSVSGRSRSSFFSNPHFRRRRSRSYTSYRSNRSSTCRSCGSIHSYKSNISNFGRRRNGSHTSLGSNKSIKSNRSSVLSEKIMKEIASIQSDFTNKPNYEDIIKANREPMKELRNSTTNVSLTSRFSSYYLPPGFGERINNSF